MMKYLKQLGIILGIAFIGEILNAVLPLPVPASVYGIILLFLLLCFRVIKVEMIKEVSTFFIGIMPIYFIAPTAGLIDVWNLLRPVLLPFLVICVIVTVAIMFVSGNMTQFLMRHTGKRSADPGTAASGKEGR